MTFSVTVRNEVTGLAVHISGLVAVDASEAAYAVHDAPASDWSPGPAACEFYQLDPGLDGFSHGYYSRLEDAQADGLRWYREHNAIMSDELGQLSYVQSETPPPFVADDGTQIPQPDVWNIVDAAHPGQHIGMCQIVKYDLWTARQTHDGPLPEPLARPQS